MQVPYVLAMILCDRIHRDPTSGKPYLLGCLTELQFKELPATYSSIGLYVELTDGRGTMDFHVDLVSVDEEYTIGRVGGEITFVDPLGVLEIGMSLEEVVIPHAGEYRVRLFVENQLMLERRLDVRLKDAQP